MLQAFDDARAAAITAQGEATVAGIEKAIEDARTRGQLVGPPEPADRDAGQRSRWTWPPPDRRLGRRAPGPGQRQRQAVRRHRPAGRDRPGCRPRVRQGEPPPVLRRRAPARRALRRPADRGLPSSGDEAGVCRTGHAGPAGRWPPIRIRPPPRRSGSPPAPSSGSGSDQRRAVMSFAFVSAGAGRRHGARSWPTWPSPSRRAGHRCSPWTPIRPRRAHCLLLPGSPAGTASSRSSPASVPCRTASSRSPLHARLAVLGGGAQSASEGDGRGVRHRSETGARRGQGRASRSS